MHKIPWCSRRIRATIVPFRPMPSRKSPSAPKQPIEEDRLERLADAVETLSEEVHILREAVDDVRQEIEYTARQLRATLEGIAFHAASIASPTLAEADDEACAVEPIQENSVESAHVPIEQGSLF